jgi:hypothetical protein
MDNEICWECGVSVKEGSGNFISRISLLGFDAPVKDKLAEYPDGDFICADCNDGYIELKKQLDNFKLPPWFLSGGGCLGSKCKQFQPTLQKISHCGLIEGGSK